MLIEQKLNNIKNNSSIHKSFFSINYQIYIFIILVKLINLYEIFKLNTNNLNLNPKNLILSIKIFLFNVYNNHPFFSRIQNDLESARKEIQIHQNELSHLRQQLSQIEQNRIQLQNEFERTKQQCRQLERQIFEKDESKKNVDLLIDQYRQQLTNEKELRLSNLKKK